MNLKKLAIAVFAFSATMALAQQPAMQNGSEKLYGTYYGTGPCQAGQIWTAVMQCEQGTRKPIERIFYGSGVEVCAVVEQSCQPARFFPTPTGGQVGHEVIDGAGWPLAVVIYGIERLMGMLNE